MKKLIKIPFKLGITKTKLILTVVFIILKFNHVGTMPWFFVFLPLYITLLFAFMIFLISAFYFVFLPRKTKELVAKMYRSKLKAV